MAAAIAARWRSASVEQARFHSFSDSRLRAPSVAASSGVTVTAGTGVSGRPRIRACSATAANSSRLMPEKAAIWSTPRAAAASTAARASAGVRTSSSYPSVPGGPSSAALERSRRGPTSRPARMSSRNRCIACSDVVPVESGGHTVQSENISRTPVTP